MKTTLKIVNTHALINDLELKMKVDYVCRETKLSAQRAIICTKICLPRWHVWAIMKGLNIENWNRSVKSLLSIANIF